MHGIIEIIKKNNKTFYNYSNGEPLNTLRFFLYKLLLSTIILLLFYNVTDKFMGAVLTIYSILTGFSFNVLFYLMSIKKLNENDKSLSLEKQTIQSKLNRLKDELFYNISYFNVISLLLILLSIFFYMVESNSLKSIIELKILLVNNFIKDYHSFVNLFSMLIKGGFKLFFYFLVIESLYTFLRVVVRINFYFNEKMKFDN